MDWADHLAALRDETSRFAAVVATGDLDRPVAACGAWTMGDLARHLGAVHRWSASAVRDGRPTEPPEGPTVQAALHAWYVEAACGLVADLEVAGPERPCWTLWPPRCSGFWARRQLQETLVHRWDAEASQGSAGPLDIDRCVDGIDEVATMFYPRQLHLGRAEPLTRAVALAAAGRRWQLGDGAPAATLSGPPDRLLLALWGRLERADPSLGVEGDGGAVDRLFAVAVVP